MSMPMIVGTIIIRACSDTKSASMVLAASAIGRDR